MTLNLESSYYPNHNSTALNQLNIQSSGHCKNARHKISKTYWNTMKNFRKPFTSVILLNVNELGCQWEGSLIVDDERY